MARKSSSVDLVGVDDPWVGVDLDLSALRDIVCQVFRVSTTECGPPLQIGLDQQIKYARVYSFQLPSQKIVARLVAPVKPLFKTENEIAAMNFARTYTSLPIPKVFAYSSDANNPVGAEWLLMEFLPGTALGDAWDNLQSHQKQRLALDVVDLFDQLCRLKANQCGGIYHSVHSVDDRGISAKSGTNSRSHRWFPLSERSLQALRSHCHGSVKDEYRLGPMNDISLLNYSLKVPGPSQTLPVATSHDYVSLIGLNGNPTTRSEFDLPTREKCVELFDSVYKFYPTSTSFGPSADHLRFCFSHGDLHEGNVLIDPESGAITGIIDWEAAGFRPMWSEVQGAGWFDEERERFIFGSDDPGNFEDDSNPADQQLRALFRTELHRRNGDLFSSFMGAIELRAILHAAGDDPRPYGETDIFLSRYHRLGCWHEARRGPFPWDMNAWLHRRMDLDEMEMARQKRIGND